MKMEQSDFYVKGLFFFHDIKHLIDRVLTHRCRFIGIDVLCEFLPSVKNRLQTP
jgi:hypothetical protein